MRLLFITQALDLDDPTLSVYHSWVAALAEKFDCIEVVCLYEGRHELPHNVRIHTLGKERGGASRFIYAWRFMSLAWRLRRSYDAAFVHMNQEYLLLAGLLWRILGKPAYLWRNHYAGTVLTDVAVSFAVKVFCTSKHSYTSRYQKTVIMPVGIEYERFSQNGSSVRKSHSVLFLARIAPSKRPEILIDALGMMLSRKLPFTASIYGSYLPEDESYARALVGRAKARGLGDRLQFHDGIPNDKTADIYRAHDIFVNCSPSGMFDKTLFEAAAAGCRVVAASDDFRDAAGDACYAPDAETLALRLESLLAESEDTIARSRNKFRSLALNESLPTLADRLAAELI